MREIKFRAWYTPFKGNKFGQEYFYGDKAFNFYRISPEKYELEQYTGLKDKNGVEIYEGDIVKVTGLFGYEFTGKVVYEKFCFNIKDFYCSGFDYPTLAFSEYDLMQFEVIGNIHENPELLEN